MGSNSLEWRERDIGVCVGRFRHKISSVIGDFFTQISDLIVVGMKGPNWTYGEPQDQNPLCNWGFLNERVVRGDERLMLSRFRSKHGGFTANFFVRVFQDTLSKHLFGDRHDDAVMNAKTGHPMIMIKTQ